MRVFGFRSPFKGSFQVPTPLAAVTARKLARVPGQFALMTSGVLLYDPSYRQGTK